MTKPRLFIASSVEGLQVAYALQECLDHDAECTIWSQGVFTLSSVALDRLRDQAHKSDFAAFIFSPDDDATIRKDHWAVVRDNVLLEFGLFAGVLGRERCFIVQPRGVKNLHLPTDVLGITPADYVPDRQDKNMVAALGTASSKIRQAMKVAPPVAPNASTQNSTAGDARAALRSWFQRRSVNENTRAIRFTDVDAELHLPSGSAKAHLKEIGAALAYTVESVGETQILFSKNTGPGRSPGQT